jgi:hypothetical protein
LLWPLPVRMTTLLSRRHSNTASNLPVCLL